MELSALSDQLSAYLFGFTSSLVKDKHRRLRARIQNHQLKCSKVRSSPKYQKSYDLTTAGRKYSMDHSFRPDPATRQRWETLKKPDAAKPEPS